MARADIYSPHGRGTCPVCGRPFNLTAAGRLYQHTDFTRRDPNWPFRAPRCEGAGRAPKAAA